MVLGDRKGVIIIACVSPLKAFFKKDGTVCLFDRGSTEAYLRSGRVTTEIVRKYPFLSEAYDRSLDLFDVPCGRCLNCRLSYARTWSQRCLLESKCYDDNWFITLTYDDDNLVYGSSDFVTLVPRDVVLFLKNLREFYRDKNHVGIRFYLAGEYGDSSMRPHYHFLAFNLPIYDLKYYCKSELGDAYYNSDLLSKLWNKGHVVVGELNERSAAYTARYCMKKAQCNISYDDLGIHKEYVRMSNRPGIGFPYLDLHLDDIYDCDQIYLPGGKIVKPCRYFDDQARKRGIDVDTIKEKRRDIANLIQNVKCDMVSRDYYNHLDDLEKEFEKKSKCLTRSL